MINRRNFLAAGALTLLAACSAPTLVDESVSANWWVRDVFVDTSELSGVSGRSLAVASDQVGSDVDRALRQQLRGLSRAQPVNVEVKIESVRLVSPGQSLLVGGLSTISGTVRVIDARSGEVLLPTSKISGSAQGYAPGGIIGALSRPSPEKDYQNTVAGFAVNTRKLLFGA
jgi:hypothetical protein